MAVRLITAAVGIAVGIGVLFLSDTMFFYIVLATISLFIIHELFTAEECKEYKSECITCFIYTVCVQLFLGLEALMDFDRFWRYLLSILCVFALFVLFVIDKKRIPFDKLCVMAASAVLVNGSISCIGTVKDYSDVHGVCYVVLVLAGAWLGDAGAYFVGSAIGKHKLCPDISPKKTVEGAIGGVVTTGIIFVIYAYFYRMVQLSMGVSDFSVNYIILAVVGMVCAVLGMLGDLSASLVKRQTGIKDFGKLMPGHGGMLDRFDSVLFVAPFLAIVLKFLPIFG